MVSEMKSYMGTGNVKGTVLDAQKLKNMYASRIQYYDQAKIKLSGEDISTELLISELMALFRN